MSLSAIVRLILVSIGVRKVDAPVTMMGSMATDSALTANTNNRATPVSSAPTTTQEV